MAQHSMFPQDQPAPAPISQLTHKIPTPEPLHSHLVIFPSTEESQGQPDANEVFEAEVWWGGDCLMSAGGGKVLAVPRFLNYPQFCKEN